MNNTEVTTRPARTSLHLEFAPVVSSIAAAIACLAFFRPWTEFSLNMGSPGAAGSGPVSFSGAALAKQFSGPVPSLSWLVLTQVFLLAILLASFIRMFSTSFIYRSGYSMIVVALAVPVILWPAQAMGTMTRRLGHLSSRGMVKMQLGVWWWIYAGVLVVAIIFAIIDFGISVRLGRTGPIPGQGRPAN
ncbi:MAG TPA: hypothetical protein VEZ90_09845 [Blastocatellia bacterium]|nr:hypothetical protein [Blastocatellia bacterium]